MTTSKSKRGIKKCSKCGEPAGVKTKVCKKCQTPFPKSRATSKPDTGIRKAIEQIKALGGIEAVKKQIDALEKQLGVLEPLGGLASAKESVALMEELKNL